MAPRIDSYRNLRVYQGAMDAAMRVFDISKSFPPDERYSLADQVRRSSRSVCANLAEAWRKRRYRAAFVAKLSDAESEACETQVWIELAYRCHYVTSAARNDLDKQYEHLMSQVVCMINDADKWLIK
jgi:four helix bundle protein